MILQRCVLLPVSGICVQVNLYKFRSCPTFLCDVSFEKFFRKGEGGQNLCIKD